MKIESFLESIPEKIKTSLFFSPFILFAIFAIFFLIGLFAKKIRYADKSVSLYLCFAVFLLERIFKSGLYAEEVFCLIMIPPVILSFILRVQSNATIRLSNKEKRLIARLSAKMQDEEQPSRTIRRIEYCRPESSEGKTLSNEIEPDPVGIKKAIALLKRRQLTEEETKRLEKIELDAEKFASHPPADFERAIYSQEIMDIIKACSKYKIF